MRKDIQSFSREIFKGFLLLFPFCLCMCVYVLCVRVCVCVCALCVCVCVCLLLGRGVLYDDMWSCCSAQTLCILVLAGGRHQYIGMCL